MEIAEQIAAPEKSFIPWSPSRTLGEEFKLAPKAKWNQLSSWNSEASRLGIRSRVFCSSSFDVFDCKVPPQWRIQLVRLICETRSLDWFISTKNIGNAASMLESAFRAVHHQREGWADNFLPNFWLGATVCNQADADRDIPKLLDVPAAGHFLNMAPLLGAVDLANLRPSIFAATANALTGTWKWDRGPKKTESRPLDLVVVGGEGGPGARPMHPNWVNMARAQCEAAGVSFAFRSWGEWKPISEMAEAEHSALYKSNRKARGWEDQGVLDDVFGRRCLVDTAVVHADGSVHQKIARSLGIHAGEVSVRR